MKKKKKEENLGPTGRRAVRQKSQAKDLQLPNVFLMGTAYNPSLLFWFYLVSWQKNLQTQVLLPCISVNTHACTHTHAHTCARTHTHTSLITTTVMKYHMTGDIKGRASIWKFGANMNHIVEILRFIIEDSHQKNETFHVFIFREHVYFLYMPSLLQPLRDGHEEISVVAASDVTVLFELHTKELCDWSLCFTLNCHPQILCD